MANRIIGIDVARVLAIFGMIIVNFKIVFGQTGNELTRIFAAFFEGKAAATFVVLAGVGIALMSNLAIRDKDSLKIKNTQISLAKKSLFLFAAGLLFLSVWIADILHFYGVYILITLLLLKSSKKTLLTISLVLVFIYPLLMYVWSYDTAWNFETYEYAGFWTVVGFFRSLFYNGFHPVIPWLAFMLMGLWFGKHNLSEDKFIKKSGWISLLVFITCLISSQLLISFLSGGTQFTALELKRFFGTSPMPPMPIYMITGTSFAIFIISLSIKVAKRFKENLLIIALNITGQLALTLYIAHIIIGIGIFEITVPEKLGNYSIEFSVIYALSFSVSSVVFAVVWAKYKKKGPLEWLMRKLTY